MRKLQGLTLIELLVTLAIVTLLVTVGVPMFQQLTASARARSDVTKFQSALYLARSEAVKRGQNVVVCSKADRSPTDYTCGDVTQWNNGFMVMVPGEAFPIRTFSADPGSFTVTTTAAAITYRADGSAIDVDMDFSHPSKRGDLERCVSIEPTGGVRVEKEACN
jgi:type IV fimbrial biogenesis protein FimT